MLKTFMTRVSSTFDTLRTTNPIDFKTVPAILKIFAVEEKKALLMLPNGVMKRVNVDSRDLDWGRNVCSRSVAILACFLAREVRGGTEMRQISSLSSQRISALLSSDIELSPRVFSQIKGHRRVKPTATDQSRICTAKHTSRSRRFGHHPQSLQ